MSMENLREALREVVGARGLSSEDAELWAYARDLSVRSTLQARAGVSLRRPLAVVWPRDLDQVQRLVAVARAHQLALLPFGAGSGVVGGGQVAQQRSARPQVVVDLKRMQDISLDSTAGWVRVGPGWIGEQLERWLNARGQTLGHFPSSISCSTVGGWVATRSAGQLSSRYGKIEDMLLAAEGVDGLGRVWNFSNNDNEFNGLKFLLGNEGGLFIITRMVLRVQALAPARLLRGAAFASVEAALLAMRQIMQQGYRPSVLRVYDPLDTALSGHAGEAGDSSLSGVEPGPISAAALEKIRSPEPGQRLREVESGGLAAMSNLRLQAKDLGFQILRGLSRQSPGLWAAGRGLVEPRLRACRMIYGFEGEVQTLQTLEPELRRLIAEAGGRDLGPEPGRHWLQRRYGVSYKLSRILEAGLWADTFEVAIHWAGVAALYQAVRAAVSPQVLCLAHFSHAYQDGCSIYFTFVGGGAELDQAQARHAAAWEAGLAAAQASGATLSHHHGVGRLKAAAFARAQGPGGGLLLRQLKQILDPDSILNPGVLGMGGEIRDTEHANPEASPAGDAQSAAPSWSAPKDGLTWIETSGLVLVDPQLTGRDFYQLLAAMELRLAHGAMHGLEDSDLSLAQSLAAKPGPDAKGFEAKGPDAKRPDSNGRGANGQGALQASMVAMRGQVLGQALHTPLAPRAATGPDLMALAQRGGLAQLDLDGLAFAVTKMIDVKPAAARESHWQRGGLAQLDLDGLAFAVSKRADDDPAAARVGPQQGGLNAAEDFFKDDKKIYKSKDLAKLFGAAMQALAEPQEVR